MVGVMVNKAEKPIRVQKYLAACGVASRREADRMVEEGRVQVGGYQAFPGDTCLPGKDKVSLDGRLVPWRPENRMVLVMNKPKGYLCSNRDPKNSKTIFTLLPENLQETRLFCVGRLDKESEGLVLLTNDGDLAQSLAHPKAEVTKRYRVVLDKALQTEDVRKLLRGITWEGERLKVEKVIPLKGRGPNPKHEVEVHMHHGKKREIRRLLYAFGYKTKRLVRIQIGQFALKGLAKGRFRELKPKEIDSLFD